MDLLNKRLTLANRAVQATTQLVDARNTLKELKEEFIGIASPFQDSDFVPGTPAAGASYALSSALTHLDAYTISALFSNVLPSIETTIVDQLNGNFNQNILLKVKK